MTIPFCAAPPHNVYRTENMDDYDKIINLISPKEKQKALDAPSGQGQITKLLLEKGLSVDCLDMVSQRIYSLIA